MPSYDQNDIIGLVAEVDFEIKIDTSELSFWDYRNKLYSKLYSKSESNNKNERSPIEYYVRNKLKNITRYKKTFYVVTDYSEREGSFIISFSFFVFSTIMNYGELRESLEYLKKDFDYIFQDIDYRTNINYDIKWNDLTDNIHDKIISRTVIIINREIKKTKVLVILIASFALVLSYYAIYKVDYQPSQTTLENSNIQAIVRNELDKMNAEKNSEEMVQLLKQQLQLIKSDTTKRQK